VQTHQKKTVVMNKYENCPSVPEGTRCKNPECLNPIGNTQEYVHICRSERNSETGNDEFFCCTACHLAYTRARRVVTLYEHSGIPFFA